MNCKRTIFACYVGYIVQALVNNFVPLLYVTFNREYNISMSKISLLITINFAIQILVDFVSARLIDKIGLRTSVILSHVFSSVGFILLAFLPGLCSNPFAGIVVSVAFYAVGGGLLEVIISPLIEACPTENKEKAMSMLHSFYCWGHVGVVLVSTLFFTIFGINNWKIISLLWALLPLLNIYFFATCPIYKLIPDTEKGLSLKELFGKKIFWLFFVMMICAGASEQAVSQWASTFAERGLGFSKTLGDLVGPMGFAICMGLSRLLYGKLGHKLDLRKAIIYSCVLCIVSYLCIALVPNALINLIFCGVCGFSVGIFWPGTYSRGSQMIKNGGTMMFAFLSLGGDVGCCVGPTIAGVVAEKFSDNLHIGILAAIGFPVVLFLGLLLGNKKG